MSCTSVAPLLQTGAVASVFLGFLLLQLASSDPYSTRSLSSDRIIIVYPLDGCRGSTSESASIPSLSGLELQSPKRARDIALSELERRVNDLRNGRNAELRNLSPIESSLALDEQSSLKLNTRYLNAMQMEITTVPSFMTEDEMIDLSDSLPCVQMVSKDYVKTIQDDSESVPFDRHLAEVEYTERAFRKSKDHSPSNLQGSGHFVEGVEELMTPNDQLFPDQWHLQQSQEWSIGSQRGWSNWRGSSDMVVAIIDSGCDLNHPDLSPKKWINTGEICGDGIDNDHNGYIDDCYGWDWVDNDNSPLPEGSGHGTAAAGIIAATTNNLLGVAGICWDCRIMCLRFIQGVEGRVSNQVAAIDYAAKMGAKISNNSYGGYGFSRLEFEVISRAHSYGHLFVSSAGNNNYNTDLPQYDHTPSIYNLDNILAVGASTKSGKKASFSNYGRVSVDFFAPGSRIVTVENGGGYSVVSGTSFAAPMGAGASALIWSRFPTLNNIEVIRTLITSCQRSQDLSELAVCGGVINIDSAMQVASQIAREKSRSGRHISRETAEDDLNHNKNNSDTIGSEDTPSLTPSASQGYTGWLGAFLSGFNRAFVHPTGEGTVMVESDTIKKSLHEPYLLFKGSNGDGRSITVDPMYLNEQEFDSLLNPYESALGVVRGITAGETENVALEGVGRESEEESINNDRRDNDQKYIPVKSWAEKATGGIERIFTSFASPTLGQLQWMSSLKSLVWDRKRAS